MLNAHYESLEFELPVLTDASWRRWLDTSLASPDDICRWDASPEHRDRSYRVQDRSVVMLIAFDKRTS
jgi:glycogen operon protein